MQVINQAHDRKSFNELIAPCIENGLGCVDEDAEVL
jgi:hypothetical protein